MFSEQVTQLTNFQTKLTPFSGNNWLYVVLPYYLSTASRLHASISNFSEILALFVQRVLH